MLTNLSLDIIYNITINFDDLSILNFRSVCKYFSLIKFELKSYYTISNKRKLLKSNFLSIPKIKIYSLGRIEQIKDRSKITHLKVISCDACDYTKIFKLKNLTHLIFIHAPRINLNKLPPKLQYIEFVGNYFDSIDHIKTIVGSKIKLEFMNIYESPLQEA